jgi:hypothetical protein
VQYIEARRVSISRIFPRFLDVHQPLKAANPGFIPNEVLIFRLALTIAGALVERFRGLATVIHKPFIPTDRKFRREAADSRKSILARVESMAR